MKTGLRLAIWLIVALAAGFFLFRYTRERQLRNECNSIITELVDHGRFAEAVRRLEPLRDRGSADLRTAVRRALAEAHRGWAHAEGVSPAERDQRLRKAQEVDPTVLTDEDRQLLEASR